MMLLAMNRQFFATISLKKMVIIERIEAA